MAKKLKDFSRVTTLESTLREAGESVCLPLHLSSVIVVPNLTSIQQTTITNVLRRIIKSRDLRPFERQALKHTVRIVHSSPHSMRSVLQVAAMKQCRSASRPQCTCSIFANVVAQFGSPRLIDGHAALVPWSLIVGGGGNLRPNDLVPVCGKLSREKVCQGIRAFCKKLSVAVADSDHFLPISLFT